MKLYLALTCPGLLLAGCSTTYDVPRDWRTVQFTEAREALNGNTVEIDASSGHTITLDLAQFRPTTLVGVYRSDSLVTLRLGEVREVFVTSYGRGARRGAMGGAVISGVLGLAYVGLLAGAFDFHGRVDGADLSLFVLGCAGVGAVVGAAIGVAAFSTDHYRFGGKVAPAGHASRPPKERTAAGADPKNLPENN